MAESRAFRAVPFAPLPVSAVGNGLAVPSLQPLGLVRQSITLHIHSPEKQATVIAPQNPCRSTPLMLISFTVYRAFPVLRTCNENGMTLMRRQ